MSLRTSREGDVVVVAVEGQLVAGNRQQLREAVMNEVERGARSVVIDFVDTGYIDSAGLGVLVSLSKKLREADASLRLIHLNEDLRTLFELTRLDTLFDLDAGSEIPDRRPATPRRTGRGVQDSPDDEARP